MRAGDLLGALVRKLARVRRHRSEWLDGCPSPAPMASLHWRAMVARCSAAALPGASRRDSDTSWITTFSM